MRRPTVVLGKAADPGASSTCAARRAARARRTRSNHGLREIRAEGWYEAVARHADVIFTFRSLRPDGAPPGTPGVGKDGAAAPANFMNRFISFEYIGAQAARAPGPERARRAGLPGGRRPAAAARDLAIGEGEIDTSSLADDTFATTFNVQLAGSAWSSSRTRSCGRRSRATSPRLWTAAGALGPRQRPGHAALPAPLCIRSAGHLGGVRLRADLVLGLPDARADGALVGLAGDALRARPRDLDQRVAARWALNSRDVRVRDAVGLRAGQGTAARRSGGGADLPGLTASPARRPIRSLDALPDWLLLFAYVWLSTWMLAACWCGGSRPSPTRAARAPAALRGRPRPLLCAITAAAYVRGSARRT